MSTEGKVQVVVRSRKVPCGTTEVSLPLFSPLGLRMGETRDRMVLYESVLDEMQHKAIDEGKELARAMGLELEVVDESKVNFLNRVASALSRRSFRPPALLIAQFRTTVR